MHTQKHMHIKINTHRSTDIQSNHPLTNTLTPVHMGTAVFTLCMRTGKKHTNPQWTPTLIECDSLCILSIALGSWQIIGIYSSLNHWWTPQRCWVVINRWSAVGLAMLRWHGTLIPLTLKMRARIRGGLEAPMQNDKMCMSVFKHRSVWVWLQAFAQVYLFLHWFFLLDYEYKMSL